MKLLQHFWVEDFARNRLYLGGVLRGERERTQYIWDEFYVCPACQRLWGAMFHTDENNQTPFPQAAAAHATYCIAHGDGSFLNRWTHEGVAPITQLPRQLLEYEVLTSGKERKETNYDDSQAAQHFADWAARHWKDSLAGNLPQGGFEAGGGNYRSRR